MTKYAVEWTEEVWKRVVIEAESEDQARELFWTGAYDDTFEYVTGGEIQDSVTIEEDE